MDEIMRVEVVQLAKMGTFPKSTTDIDAIELWQETLETIKPPLSDEEAAVLVGLFPENDDDCFGLAWTLIHLIETAPNWPLKSCLETQDNPWIFRLRQA